MNSKKMWVWMLLAVAAVLVLLFAWNTYRLNKAADEPVESAEATTTDTKATTGGSKSQTVASIIAGIPEGTRFAGLFTSTGVGATITGKGPYTVFVSTDGAFARATPGSLDGMTAAEKKRLIQNHIIAGKKIDATALNTGEMQSLSGDTLNFNKINDDAGHNVGSGLIIRTYQASNGVVYLINAVLFPPEPIR